ncbi:MAG: hypothetical protein ACKVZH_03910 [Blastocatellia bacterium]
MTCQEFEQIVAELVADKLTSARARVSAMTHAAVCQNCGARLTAEKLLDAGLIVLAERTQAEQAPPRLRQSLSAAFEAQQAKVDVNVVEPKASWLDSVKAVFVWQQDWRWSLAATAAAVVLTVGAAIWWQQQTPSGSELTVVASPTVTPSPKTIEPQVEPTTNLANQAATVEKRNVKRFVSPRRQQAQSGSTELTANFIPLSYAAGSATPDESLVVRVDVPRTTLIAMGLPLNIERGHEMVKADLRVGIDGVPLAIRLVR